MKDNIMIRIVEARVNGVPEWRVYINRELRSSFKSPSEAVNYAETYAKQQQNIELYGKKIKS